MPNVQYIEIKESFLMALNAIRINKLRSSLTLLGIVIGVFSIVAVMTAMGVMQNSIESGLSMLGTNTFQVQKFPITMGGGGRDRRMFRNRKDITFDQGLAVQHRATLARFVGLEAWEMGKVVKVEREETNPSVMLAGETPEGLPTNNWIVKEGRGLNQSDIEYADNVIVLGANVVDKLFPFSNPIGEQVTIDGHRYRVIGYFEQQGGFQGSNQDNFVAMPISTFFNTYGEQNRSIHIMVQSITREVYDDAIEQVRGILRSVRRVSPGEEDEFAIFSNDSLIEQWNELTFYVKVGIGFISFIALLAAGIGIMNIMLVSVTERTREIGIRKAVGTKKKDILTQFITEAIVLCQVGGVIGVILGILGGNLAALAFDFPAIIPYDWAVIGLVICSVVGIVFGTYPAWKAANLDPIESLRYE